MQRTADVYALRGCVGRLFCADVQRSEERKQHAEEARRVSQAEAKERAAERKRKQTALPVKVKPPHLICILHSHSHAEKGDIPFFVSTMRTTVCCVLVREYT